MVTSGSLLGFPKPGELDQDYTAQAVTAQDRLWARYALGTTREGEITPLPCRPVLDTLGDDVQALWLAHKVQVIGANGERGTEVKYLDLFVAARLQQRQIAGWYRCGTYTGC